MTPASRCCKAYLCEDELTIKQFDHISVLKVDRWKTDLDEFRGRCSCYIISPKNF